MKGFVVIGFILIGVLSFQEHHVRSDCVPGTVFKKDCNTCHCSTTGLEACTRKRCLPEVAQNEQVQNDSPLPQECVPGTRFKIDCNDCHCTEAGIVACTKKGCISFLDKEMQSDEPQTELYNNQVCKPNEIKMEDCNRCRCANNGIGFFCTRNICPPNKDITSPNFRCNPGETFKNDCKTCTCLPDGKTASCTPETCPSGDVETSTHKLKREIFLRPNPSDFKCTPGQKFGDACNECTCLDNGIYVLCTKKSCSLDHIAEQKPNLLPEMELKKNSLFPVVLERCHIGDVIQNNCNICRCIKTGEYQCTQFNCDETNNRLKRSLPRQVTDAEISSPKFRCTPGESLQNECNTCRCLPDGKDVACTEIGCLSSIRVLRATQECEPGTHWMNDCNNCRCSPNGKAMCTRMACPPRTRRSTNIRQVTQEELRSKDFQCTPGEAMQLDCNTCTCAPNGKTVACTLAFCLPKSKRSTAVRELTLEEVRSSDFSCIPGESMKLDCNSCTCSPNGKLAACTLRGCLSKSKRSTTVRELTEEEVRSKDFTCTPGESMKLDCNSCICSPNGKLAACTLKGCPSKSKRSTTVRELTEEEVRSKDFTCTPGESMKLDCNSCICSPNGKLAACTLKGCPSKSKRSTTVRELTEEEVRSKDFTCTPGEVMSLDCNSCTCSPNGKLALCTLKGCPSKSKRSTTVRELTEQEVRSKDFTCIPGESMKLDCNSCICSPNGKLAACTLRACLRKKREVEKCVPGETKRLHCNDCQCTSIGVWKCTRKICVTDSEKSKRDVSGQRQCEPGTVFKDDCNTCRCSSTGIAACTKRMCIPNTDLAERQKREFIALDTPVSRCTPNGSFKRDCNTCFCGPNGEETGCTYKLCEPKEHTVQKRDATIPNTEGFTCVPGSVFKYECNTCTCDEDGKTAACTYMYCIPGEY